MKTILIPVDDSATCLNTLKYVARLSHTIQAERIILLKSLYVSVYAQLLPSADFVLLSAAGIEEQRLHQEQQLRLLSSDLSKNCNTSTKVELASSQEPILRAVTDFIAAHQTDMIVIGTDGELEESGSEVGQEAVAIAKASTIPVLAVPHNAHYKPLKQALIPCDFSSVSRLSILKDLDNLKLSAKPQLMILNVDPQHKHLSEEAKHADALKTFLESYQYEVHYTDDRDTVRGIINFADSKEVQLIIALPGKHSFFYNLTHQSITEGLALNSHLPILILK